MILSCPQCKEIRLKLEGSSLFISDGTIFKCKLCKSDYPVDRYWDDDKDYLEIIKDLK